ncbi:hypothetical protein N9A94_01075 [Akkermansiaceae bacterium]|nr:hypothetical protein [Akkermansiaceae bacterium]
MKKSVIFVVFLFVFQSCCIANEGRTIAAILSKLEMAGMSYPKSMDEGSLYVSLCGGFGGQITEVYVPSDRETVRVSRAYPPVGNRSDWIIVRRILRKKEYANLLKLLEKISNEDLPPEVASRTVDDAQCILVAKKEKGHSSYKYCARMFADPTGIEIDLRKCIRELGKFNFPKNVSSILK